MFGGSHLRVKTGTAERQLEWAAFALPGFSATDHSSCSAARRDCNATVRHCLPTLTAFQRCACQSEMAAVPGAGGRTLFARTELCPPSSPNPQSLSNQGAVSRVLVWLCTCIPLDLFVFMSCSYYSQYLSQDATCQNLFFVH